MAIERFIAVGENIHCTRIYKVGGKFCKEADGGYVIEYKSGGETKQLPVPEVFTQNNDWEAGKVKHCAVAIWQGQNGDEAAQAAGKDYIASLAKRQEAADATYLDINVDEYSTDNEERIRMMNWCVDVVQNASSLPISVDSSNTEILRAGLKAIDASNGRPMVNSVSLERMDAIAVAAEHKAVIIASAAGEKDLPSTNDERMANLNRLMPMLKDASFENDAIHVDPLVLPISVDGNNGKSFLEAVTTIRETYGPDIHIVAGLSNVSFGMPNRKLINQVFSHLAVLAGADGGIVDPDQINAEILNGLDTESNGYQLAKALLMGEDEFGMNFIMAAREGSL